MMQFKQFLVTILFLSRSKVHADYGQDPLAIQLKTGLVFGTTDTATPSVRQFLGIPYAKSPIGNLRFAPPQPGKHFGKLNATKLPPSCMQAASDLASSQHPEFLVHGNVSEDCLTLSIWTPAGKKPDDNLPVLIFLHGGAFAAGGQSVPYQIPAQWVQRTKSHIVVSLNYRLGPFGFPTDSALKQKNVGLLDQRLAVEWTRDNIAAFGGNPERMVLWGQSAGAISVGYWAYTYPADAIVKGLIMDSGTEYTFPTKQFTGEDPSWTNMTMSLGCGGLSQESQLDCMRKVPAKDILDKSMFFGPVVDNQVVFANYSTLANAGRFAKIPVIIGSNEGENGPFLPAFFCASWRTANDRLLAKAQTFRYYYHGDFRNIVPDPSSKAPHSSELPLLFGTHSLYRGNSTALEWATSVAMQDAWLAFARGGPDELGRLRGWPLHDKVLGGKVRNFGDGVAEQDGDTFGLELKCRSSGAGFRL